MEQIGGSRSGDGHVDFGHVLQTDFEAVESAWKCLEAIFSDQSEAVEL